MITQEQLDRALENYCVQHGYREDIERFQKCARQMGLRLSSSDAKVIWKEYSDYYGAGWLSIGEYDEPSITSAIIRFVDAYELY